MIPRILLGVAGAVLVLLPWPAPLSFAGVVTLGGAAAAVWALRAPGSLGPLVLITTAVVSWLAAVPDPGPARILCFATAAYVVHSAAALSAAVPAGAPVGAGLLRHWVASTVAVLLLGWAAVGLTAFVPGQRGAVALVVLGMLAAVTLVALPAVVLRWSRT